MYLSSDYASEMTKHFTELKGHNALIRVVQRATIGFANFWIGACPPLQVFASLLARFP